MASENTFSSDLWEYLLKWPLRILSLVTPETTVSSDLLEYRLLVTSENSVSGDLCEYRLSVTSVYTSVGKNA